MEDLPWKEQVAKTLIGFGYRMLDLQFNPRLGTIRIFIERNKNYIPGKFFAATEVDIDPISRFPQLAKFAPAFTNRVSVDDCAFVSNHISRLLTVENANYQRLEISSPGVDRKIYDREEFNIYSGMPIKLTLKKPVENSQGNLQKNFQGTYTFSENSPEIKLFDGDDEFEFDYEQILTANLDEDEILSRWGTRNQRKSRKNKKFRT